MTECPTCGRADPEADYSITAPCFSDNEATDLLQELVGLLSKKGAVRFRSKYDPDAQIFTVEGWGA